MKIYLLKKSSYRQPFDLISVHRTKAGAFKSKIKRQNEDWYFDREIGDDAEQMHKYYKYLIIEMELSD